MSLLWLEGFELLGQTGYADRYFGVDSPLTVGTPGNTFLALIFPSSKSQDLVFTSPVFANSVSLILGAAIMLNDVQLTDLIRFNADTTAQFVIQVDNAGHLVVVTDAGSYTTSNTLTSGVFNYIEVKTYIGPGNGSVEIRVNEDVWLTHTQINNVNPAAPVAGSFPNYFVNNVAFVVQSTSTTAMFLDDIYLCDTNGHANFDYLGKSSVIEFVPEANGVQNQWTTNNGAANFSCVREIGPDGDATYIQAGPPNPNAVEEFYSFPPLQNMPFVAGVNVCFVGRKDGPRPGVIAPAVQQTYLISVGTFASVGDSYEYYDAIWDQDPMRRTKWTYGAVNAAGYGIVRLE